MGSYLSSRTAQDFLATAFQRPSFWIGIALWAAGFVGNIVHDEILFNIRRKAQSQKREQAPGTSTKEHYAIPVSSLFRTLTHHCFPLSLSPEWSSISLGQLSKLLHRVGGVGGLCNRCIADAVDFSQSRSYWEWSQVARGRDSTHRHVRTLVDAPMDIFAC